MSNDARVRAFRDKRFCLRPAAAPDLPRASGDSGFVAHLAASTRGASGWDWNFRLVRSGPGWAFASDGRVSVFLDEPNQYVPVEAKPSEMVAVRMPRARENLVPHRFTLHGGQGGPSTSGQFVKLFIPIRMDAVGGLLELFSGKASDSIRLALHVANSPLDFDRADSAVLDVGLNDEATAVKTLDAFIRTHPKAIQSRGQPFGTDIGPLGFPRALALGRGDIADGFSWRRCSEAVHSGAQP